MTDECGDEIDDDDPRFQIRGDDHPHDLYRDLSPCTREKGHPGMHSNGTVWWT